MSDQDPSEIRKRRICADCVGEPFLIAEIEKHGEIFVCFYCQSEGKTFSVEEMADRVETAFEEHFVRTPTDPSSFEYAMIKEGDLDWERHGDRVTDVIESLADIARRPATDIQHVLEDRHADYEMAKMGEECPFDAASCYEERSVNTGEFEADWQELERALKTETRFFNR